MRTGFAAGADLHACQDGVRIVRTILREALPWRNRPVAVPVMGMTSPRGPEAWIDQLEGRALGEAAVSHDAEVAVAD